MLVEDVVCRLWPPNSKCGRESRADTGGQPSVCSRVARAARTQNGPRRDHDTTKKEFNG